MYTSVSPVDCGFRSVLRRALAAVHTHTHTRLVSRSLYRRQHVSRKSQLEREVEHTKVKRHTHFALAGPEQSSAHGGTPVTYLSPLRMWWMTARSQNAKSRPMCPQVMRLVLLSPQVPVMWYVRGPLVRLSDVYRTVMSLPRLESAPEAGAADEARGERTTSLPRLSLRAC